MVGQKQDWERGLQVGDPSYWDLLERSLLQAKMLLWKRLQHGAYADDEEAKATMDAYWAIKRVVALLEKKIRQVPLFTPPSDEDYLKQRNLLGEEVGNDPTPRP